MICFCYSCKVSSMLHIKFYFLQSNREEISVKFRLDPDIKFDHVFCQYEYGGDRLIQAIKDNEYYYCSLSVGDG